MPSMSASSIDPVAYRTVGLEQSGTLGGTLGVTGDIYGSCEAHDDEGGRDRFVPMTTQLSAYQAFAEKHRPEAYLCHTIMVSNGRR